MKKQDPAARRAAYLAALAQQRKRQVEQAAAAEAWRRAHVCNFSSITKAIGV
jgi:hypothetical protein